MSEAEKKILKYRMKNVSVDEIANLVHQDKSLKLLHDDLKQTNANVGIVYKTYKDIYVDSIYEWEGESGGAIVEKIFDEATNKVIFKVKTIFLRIS